MHGKKHRYVLFCLVKLFVYRYIFHFQNTVIYVKEIKITQFSLNWQILTFATNVFVFK